ncbi:PhzF family phenazine biosynthesis protein [Nocardioides donggukensis]|uniref:PhzF family phenazine biosynthesis isomerase n=1 Tax=Nocardioides donggukensis TaxID=2774019 RepID=A0A927K6D5_9ACTN|nr:PhzF family phenazine biosynthesis isomerase [Nocardioides donggukensis]MBD8870678.1 PhzF family phenazine biosynthesis isomerase [Nocardioides donggukensis]
MDTELLRLSAFVSDGARGGNPAGVWLGDELPSPEEMLRVAAEVGYSETAFNQRLDERRWLTRYYSPQAEVTFCGHATIATGVALGERYGPGRFVLETVGGEVPVDVEETGDGSFRATLTSVEPAGRPLPDELLAAVLGALSWPAEVLDRDLPPGLAYAGAWHLVLPVESRSRLAEMAYDFDRMRAVMLAHDLTTIQIVHREGPSTYHARDPFPVGGVVEDPATGAAAAAFGAHLRAHGLLDPPARFTIHQGYDLGRPSDLLVTVPPAGGISVTGAAAPISA